MAMNENIDVNKNDIITAQEPIQPKNEPKAGVTTTSPKANKPWNTLLGGIIVMALGFGGGWLGSASRSQTTPATIVQQKTVMASQGNVVSTIAQQVGESVVSVNVTSQSLNSNNPFDTMFGFGGGQQTEQSAGTGIILSADGLILTNRHVVPAGTTDVSITLSDGTVLKNVKVLGRTSNRDSLDVAFLKVQDRNGRTLKPATIGDSSKMKVGDPVVAIGNTLGQFQNTVTSGILSGYGRSVQASDGSGMSAENLDDLFQTDAAINQGNSGGPLVNLNGEVIGINTAIASGSQNVGFAIPINNVKGMIESVKTTGKLQRTYLGVVYVMVTDDIAKEYDLSVKRGAYVPRSEEVSGQPVVADGPAEKAGIQEGDVITKINNIAINEKTSLVALLSKYKVGDTIDVTIVRGNETKVLQATLAAAPTS